MFTDVIRLGPFAIFCPESEGDIAEDKDLHRLKIKGERVDRALLDKNGRMEVGDRQTAIGEEHADMVLGDIIADEDDVAIFVSAELVALGVQFDLRSGLSARKHTQHELCFSFGGGFGRPWGGRVGRPLFAGGDVNDGLRHDRRHRDVA